VATGATPDRACIWGVSSTHKKLDKEMGRWNGANETYKLSKKPQVQREEAVDDTDHRPVPDGTVGTWSR
jgi:hypothetical protein